MQGLGGLQGYPLHSPKGTPGGLKGYPIHPAGEATLWGPTVQGYPIPGHPHGGLEVMCQGYPIASPPFTPPVDRFRCYHLAGAGGVVGLRLLLLRLIPPATPCDFIAYTPCVIPAIICGLQLTSAIAPVIYPVMIIRGLPLFPADIQTL